MQTVLTPDADLPKKRVVSIVCPVLNEEKSIVPFLDRMEKMRQQLNADLATPIDFEYVFIDDGSTDNTLGVLLSLREKIDVIRVVELSRNFGKEAALTAGLDEAKGDAIIPIDVDLQDPPEIIPLLIEQWLNGYEVVLAKRSNRKSDTFLKRSTAHLFYRIHNMLSRHPIPENVGDFRLIDRAVVDALNKLGENNRFMKGLFSWVGFKTTTIEYERQVRLLGETKFKGWSLWNLALESVTSFSTIPLTIWTYVGVVISFLAFVMVCVISVQRIFFGLDIPGYAMLTVAVFFLSGVQLISIGMLGEYLVRVYTETKRRPIYIIRQIYEGIEQ